MEVFPVSPRNPRNYNFSNNYEIGVFPTSEKVSQMFEQWCNNTSIWLTDWPRYTINWSTGLQDGGRLNMASIKLNILGSTIYRVLFIIVFL